MSFIKKHTLVLSRLTPRKRWVVFRTLAFKSKYPHCPKKGALPVARRRGIITLTLVISRTSKKPTVMRGLFMWKIFKIKTKLQYEVDEYVIWKASKSVYTANEHKEILTNFIKSLKCLSVAEIKLEDISNFHKNLAGTPYIRIRSMQAIRGFMAYFYMKKQHNINPKQIRDQGIYTFLPAVEKNAILEPMMKKKVGRPVKVALIKKVKSLRDNENLTFRAIGKAMDLDVSQVYVWYKTELSKDLLRKID